MRWMLAVLFSFAVLGCEREAPPPAAPPEPVNVAPAPTPAPPALADEDVPVAEDFVEEASAEVTADNYAQKLDELEKEILADQP